MTFSPSRKLARPVAQVLVVSVLGLAAACGGADPQDVLQAPSAASTSGSTSSSSGASSSSGTSASSSGGTSSGNVADGGSTSGQPGCPSEDEPNDNEDDANDVVGSICGQASKDDVDFLTFDLPQSAKTVKLTFEGQVTLKVTVNGGNGVTLRPGNSQGIPFVRGGTYVVEVLAEARQTWRVNVTFQ